MPPVIHPSTKTAQTGGFTLIELSIVLVIIGLIVGGILTGRDLIKAAEARSVISDIEKYKTAAETFYGKYGCLPGDCQNATAFFGASATCGVSALTSGTCNGDGNGQLTNLYAGASDPLTGAVLVAGPAPSYGFHQSEDVLFWQQLSLAHMIEGQYSGTDNSAGLTYVVADNPVPFSARISGACYGIMNSDYNSSGARFTIPSENDFYFGGPGTPTISAGCNTGVITPSQALSIDGKIDDGQPATGGVTTWAAFAAVGCITASAPYSYITTNKGPLCALIFKAGF